MNYTLLRKRSSISVVGVVLTLLCFGVLLVFLDGPVFYRNPEQGARVRCASNLKQIGLAAIMWANDHNEKFPDDLDTIANDEDLAPSVFVCPSSNATVPQGPTTQAMIADMHQPGHLSYVYIGKGLTTKADADVVILYELPDN